MNNKDNITQIVFTLIFLNKKNEKLHNKKGNKTVSSTV